MSSFRNPSSSRSSSCRKYLAGGKGVSGIEGTPPPPKKLNPSIHVLALDVEVEDADVVNQDGEGTVGQVGGGLTQDLVQHRPVGLWVCGG